MSRGSPVLRLLLFISLAWWAAACQAQGEGRVVRIVVAAPPGGSLDTSARILASRLSALTGEVHLVENRPGANSAIAVDVVKHAPADGRTLLYSGASFVLNPLVQKVNYSVDEFIPVAGVLVEPYALVAGKALAGMDLTGMEGMARSRPAGVSCAAGPGIMALGCDQVRQRLGLGDRFLSVPYAGVAPVLQALLGGHADVGVLPVESVRPMVAAGQLRYLAVSGSSGVPTDAPKFGMIWPGFASDGLLGLFVVAGTPAEIIIKLDRDLHTVMSQPDVAAALGAQGGNPIGTESRQRFGTRLKALQASYAGVLAAMSPPR